jgi:hypothetical protein
MIRVALTPWCTNRIVSQVGMIAPFFLAPDALPAGWRACDGNHSTPDLRGKFLIGAGSRTVPMNQAQSHKNQYDNIDRYGPGFEAAEPLRMEVPLGDWLAEAGERDPDPPEQFCGGVHVDSNHDNGGCESGNDFPFGFGGAPYANYRTGAPAARHAARPPRPRRPHCARRLAI